MTITIHQGDCIEVMKTMPAESVDIVITSPPYWGLRDYGVDGQIGLEPTLEEHIKKIIEVFREVWRILKKTGTVWLNYGDCYAAFPNGRKASEIKNDDRKFRDKPFSTIQGVLKAKDLCMVPNRIAIALQEDGWWVRSEIIWGKTNPMPESVKDRPATAHEKIFMLSKSARYHYNAENVRQKRKSDEDANGFRGGSYSEGKPSKRKNKGNKKVPSGWANSENYQGQFPNEKVRDKQRGHSRRHAGFNDRWDHMTKKEQQQNGRFLKNYEPAPINVWEMAPKPFKEAHFATFPPELVERCIEAGCPEGGVVFDPFGGAGTTGLVADQKGFDSILIELSEDYIDIADKRLKKDNPLFCEVVHAQ